MSICCCSSSPVSPVNEQTSKQTIQIRRRRWPWSEFRIAPASCSNARIGRLWRPAHSSTSSNPIWERRHSVWGFGGFFLLLILSLFEDWILWGFEQRELLFTTFCRCSPDHLSAELAKELTVNSEDACWCFDFFKIFIVFFLLVFSSHSATSHRFRSFSSSFLLVFGILELILKTVPTIRELDFCVVRFFISHLILFYFLFKWEK